MKRRKKEYPIGSVSSATMREEDLIPSFLWELKNLAKRNRNGGDLKLVKVIQKRIDDHDRAEFWGTEGATWDLEALFDALDEYAGPYFYFGAHPGDGADYGFWLSDFFQGDFEGLKVTDLADVPRDYAGEILVVNDHGNMSLYNKARTQEPREIWAVV